MPQRVDSLVEVVFSSYLFTTVTSEEIGQMPAPKEQPPRKLSGKRTAWRGQHLERDASGPGPELRPPTG
jgi:hypothetical protein